MQEATLLEIFAGVPQLRLGSVYTGIGGFDLGFERAGFTVAWQIEIEKFCVAVLKSRWPDVERFNDVRECGKHNLSTVDVLAGGFPCQDLSVAGKRAGLAGERSRLFFDFVRIADSLNVRWLVLENVPGLLSASRGRDMQAVIETLTGFKPSIPQGGWRFAGIATGPKRSIAWRVLDSQFFGVAQRRERVFIVSGPRTGSAVKVLFEATRSGGDPAEVREAGPQIAATLTSGSGVAGNKPGRRREDDYNLVAQTIQSSEWRPRGDGCDNLIADGGELLGRQPDIGHARFLNAGEGPDDAREAPVPSRDIARSLGRVGGGDDPGANKGTLVVIQDIGHGEKRQNGSGVSEGETCYTLDGTSQHAVPFEPRFTRNGRGAPGPIVPPLKSQSGSSGKGDGAPYVATLFAESGGYSPDKAGANNYVCAPPHSNRVRDFAGLPEGMDSPRYRALGNAVTV